MTSVNEFAAITRRVIQKDGPDDFLPTALYPERHEVVVLDELPHVDNRVELAVEWASSRANADEDFMLAILVTPMQSWCSTVVMVRSNGTRSISRPTSNEELKPTTTPSNLVE